MEGAALLVSCLTLGAVGYLHVRLTTKTMPYTRGFKKAQDVVVLDTSALIDGKFVNILHSGFLSRELLVPEAVLNELQLLADGKDTYKRERARCGLENLTLIKSVAGVNLTTVSVGPSDDADNAVLQTAQKYQAKILSTDYALLQRAEATSIQVLNINLLITNLQDEYAVGMTVSICIEKTGETRSQGVGHAENGTLFVVENAAQLVGKVTTVRIKRISQTKTGKVVFAQPVNA